MRDGLRGLALLAGMLGALPAPALHVVSTDPPDGSEGIDPRTSAIHIRFSEPVKQTSWSFVEAEGGCVPEITGDPTFPSPTECVLPVRLQPGVWYAIGINGEGKTGFRSAADETVACDPSILRFTAGDAAGQSTAASTPGASSSTPLPAAAAQARDLPTIRFVKYADRTENAFTILVPDGWQTQGGILRVDPNMAGGPAQSIEAKFSFAVQDDAQGTRQIAWMPHFYFCDLSNSMVAGMFPTGSNYMGMTVAPLMQPTAFLKEVVIPQLRPRAQEVRIREEKEIPELARLFDDLFLKMTPFLPQMGIRFSYTAGGIDIEYMEDGRRLREKMVVVIENRGPALNGQWDNRFTASIRAPLEEYERWEPVFGVIANSSQINAQWVAGEVRGQQQRGEIVTQTLADLQRIEQDIVRHRQETNARIADSEFLNLMGQGRFQNPFTNEPEIGANNWQNRWVNNQGQVIYSNDPGFDPGADPALSGLGFARSKLVE